MRHSRRAGFTLVELLVVITIIGILIALLMPAVQTAREAARRAQCVNNLKQLSLACLNYEAAFGAFPPGIQFDQGQNPGSSDQFRANWIILILPFLEQQNLFDSFNHQEFISRDANRTARVHHGGDIGLSLGHRARAVLQTRWRRLGPRKLRSQRQQWTADFERLE